MIRSFEPPPDGGGFAFGSASVTGVVRKSIAYIQPM